MLFSMLDDVADEFCAADADVNDEEAAAASDVESKLNKYKHRFTISCAVS